jgi:predicted phosphodiesterase
MKLAVLADIHGNIPALETVTAHIERWQPDRVVVAGDIVNRGPRPLDCLRFVQAKQASAGWLVTRGNHEDYIIRYAYPDPDFFGGPEFELYRSAYWTYQQLNRDVSALEAMPFQVDLTAPNGSQARIVHASMHNNRDGVFPMTTDQELRRKINLPDQPAPPLFCTAHTHWPLLRQIDGTLVVNVGSVGLPFDGDRRAAYGQFTWQNGAWQAKIIRLDYNWRQTEQDFFETGYLAEGGPLVELILDELRAAQPNLFRWHHRYETLILANEITIADAVANFLAGRGSED